MGLGLGVEGTYSDLSDLLYRKSQTSVIKVVDFKTDEKNDADIKQCVSEQTQKILTISI